MTRLHGSVGLGGNNRASDVLAVQRALRGSGVSPGPLDGICGRHTMAAIEMFQRGFLARPDSRVDVNGPSWRRLETQAAAASASPLRHTTTAAGSSRVAPSAPQPHAKPAVGAAASRAVPVAAQRTAAFAAARAAAERTARPTPAAPTSGGEPPAPPLQHAAAYWRENTPLPASGTVNRGLASPGSSEQVARFGGLPSSHMSSTDGPITNATLKALIATESVGPFRATGLRTALASLRTIFAEVRRELPDLYPLIGTAGMEVNRLMRGSSTKVSNHAWGSAIDLTIGGKLVPFGANNSVRGLDALVPYFNRAGWYWGGAFRRGRADAMHFECGSALMAEMTR